MTLLDSLVDVVEKAQERLLRASPLLEQAEIACAVIGGNAVAAWVETTDPSVIRDTQDVDLLLAGEPYRHAAGLDMFLDDPYPIRWPENLPGSRRSGTSLEEWGPLDNPDS